MPYVEIRFLSASMRKEDSRLFNFEDMPEALDAYKRASELIFAAHRAARIKQVLK